MVNLDLEKRLTRSLFIKGMSTPSYPIIQGGMGFGISLWELASAVAREGGIGVISSANLDLVYKHRHDKSVSLRQATAWEVAKAKQESDGGTIGINIMRKVDSNHDLVGRFNSSYKESIAGAVLGGVDLIISGAGFPVELPSLVKKYCDLYGRIDADGTPQVGIIPIVSMDLATKGILKRWGKVLPDAIIIEGPRAGGHLGWPYNRMNKFATVEDFLENNDLLNYLFVSTREVLASTRYNPNGMNIPLIVAGGIDSYDSIFEALLKGASGVQIATPFLATVESGASLRFKEAIVNADESDIMLSNEKFGSPAGFPFAFLKQSPLYLDFLLKFGDYKKSGASLENFKYAFCICKALIAASTINLTEKEWGLNCLTHNFSGNDQNSRGIKLCPAIDSGNLLPLDNRLALYTSGRNVGNIKSIIPVKEVMYNLINPIKKDYFM